MREVAKEAKRRMAVRNAVTSEHGTCALEVMLNGLAWAVNERPFPKKQHLRPSTNLRSQVSRTNTLIT